MMGRDFIASQVYKRLVLSGLTICSMLPHGKMNKSNIWDSSSLAILTRAMMETYNTFFYIGVDEVSTEQLNLRISVFNLHWNIEKYNIQKDSFSPEDLCPFEKRMAEEKEALKNNEEFKKLVKELQNKILSGKTALCLSHEEIAVKIGFVESYFKRMYKLLSNHTHNSPYAFLSESEIRGRGIENEREVGDYAISVELLMGYLSMGIIGQVNLMREKIYENNKEGLIFAESIMKG